MLLRTTTNHSSDECPEPHFFTQFVLSSLYRRDLRTHHRQRFKFAEEARKGQRAVRHQKRKRNPRIPNQWCQLNGTALQDQGKINRQGHHQTLSEEPRIIEMLPIYPRLTPRLIPTYGPHHPGSQRPVLTIKEDNHIGDPSQVGVGKAR